MTDPANCITRRNFIRSSSLASLAGLGGLGQGVEGALKRQLKGKAEHCIFLWLGGGAAQMDTFDPKKKGDAKVITNENTDDGKIMLE